MSEDVVDFNDALFNKRASVGDLTSIEYIDGQFTATYRDLVYKDPSWDGLMLQLGWVDEIGFEQEHIEVVEVGVGFAL